MSAPHEVWVSSGHAAHHLRASKAGSWHPDHAVRYLRADLTCDTKWTHLATLRGVRGMVELFELDEQYAGHYHQGFGMAVSQMITVLDDLIAKEEVT